MERIPDVGRVKLLPEDSLIIMASDGLWDVLEDQQAVDIAQVVPLCPPLRHVFICASDALPYDEDMQSRESRCASARRRGSHSTKNTREGTSPMPTTDHIAYMQSCAAGAALCSSCCTNRVIFNRE